MKSPQSNMYLQRVCACPLNNCCDWSCVRKRERSVSLAPELQRTTAPLLLPLTGTHTFSLRHLRFTSVPVECQSFIGRG